MFSRFAVFSVFALMAAPGFAQTGGESLDASDESRLAEMMPTIEKDLYTLYFDFAQDPKLTPADATFRRRELLRALREGAPPESLRRSGISLEEARAILQEKNEHTVVGKEATKEIYDPTGRYGFCFGRAQWTAIELLRLGVAKESIRKIFAVGPMKDDGIDWQFHVATMVRSTDGGWFVNDDIYRKIQTVENWMADLKKSSVDGKLMFHVTDMSRLGASTTQKFTEAHFRDPLNDPDYNRYFEDMMASFRKVSREMMERKKRSCAKALN